MLIRVHVCRSRPILEFSKKSISNKEKVNAALSSRIHFHTSNLNIDANPLSKVEELELGPNGSVLVVDGSWE